MSNTQPSGNTTVTKVGVTNNGPEPWRTTTDRLVYHWYFFDGSEARWGPWHDGHLRMTDTDGDYFGYWAFEAGAVALLLDIDDSSIDHMVYPKDLVAYARKLRDEGIASPHAPTGRLRGLRNELVPKTGWWHSLARPNGQALHYFEAGQRFPDWQFTKTGAVIWDFDPDQQPPPPKK